MSAVPVKDLAPQRAAKTFSSVLLSAGAGIAVSQRERLIDCKPCNIYGVCRSCNRIIVGLDTGQIKIYDSVDLQCEAVLPYYNEQSEPCCFQCTCTEVLVGYRDGSIFAWDIKSGLMKGKISVRNASTRDLPFPDRMRWRNPKLVVSASSSASPRIQIWQYANSSFTLLGGWAVTEMSVKRIELHENYVILHDRQTTSVHVYSPNGKLLRKMKHTGNGLPIRNTTEWWQG